MSIYKFKKHKKDYDKKCKYYEKKISKNNKYLKLSYIIVIFSCMGSISFMILNSIFKFDTIIHAFIPLILTLPCLILTLRMSYLTSRITYSNNVSYKEIQNIYNKLDNMDKKLKKELYYKLKKDSNYQYTNEYDLSIEFLNNIQIFQNNINKF